jgi:hypothetical protein
MDTAMNKIQKMRMKRNKRKMLATMLLRCGVFVSVQRLFLSATAGRSAVPECSFQHRSVAVTGITLILCSPVVFQALTSLGTQLFVINGASTSRMSYCASAV